MHQIAALKQISSMESNDSYNLFFLVSWRYKSSWHQGMELIHVMTIHPHDAHRNALLLQNQMLKMTFSEKKIAGQ